MRDVRCGVGGDHLHRPAPLGKGHEAACPIWRVSSGAGWPCRCSSPWCGEPLGSGVSHTASQSVAEIKAASQAGTSCSKSGGFYLADAIPCSLHSLGWPTEKTEWLAFQWLPSFANRGSAFVLTVPLWIPFLLAAFLLMAFLRWLDHRLRILPGCCQRCGDDLTGNLSGVCPECGVAVSKRGATEAEGE